jgi:metal-sulfur cluster biosynthetic enzyme
MENLLEIRDSALELQVFNILKEVIDPELMISITDLGLIYEIKCTERGGIEVIMTLTTPHCPLGDAITTDIENRLETNFPDKPHDVSIVFDPAWHPGMMNLAAREKLNEQ